MDQFKAFVKGIDDISNGFKDLANIIDNVKPADTPEDIAKKLGEKLDNKLSPITPLAPDVETAQQETDTQILTKMEQITDIVQEKIDTMIREAIE